MVKGGISIIKNTDQFFKKRIGFQYFYKWKK